MSTKIYNETKITEGLVDVIITTLSVLKTRDLSAPEVCEALKELQQHEMTQRIFNATPSYPQLIGRVKPGLILCVERETKKILSEHPATNYPMVWEDEIETVNAIRDLLEHYTNKAEWHCAALNVVDDKPRVLDALSRIRSPHSLRSSTVKIGYDVYNPPKSEAALKELVAYKNVLRQKIDLMHKTAERVIQQLLPLSEADKALLVNASVLESACILIRFIEAIEQE